MSKSKKICVIGAGVAGLCAARFLSADPEEFDFVVFEKCSDIGGIWVYDENVGIDRHGLPIHTSMYKNLRTNIPKEIMTYPDFQQIEDADYCCVGHEAILKYLHNYANYFQLRQYIKFNTLVDNVRPIKSSDDEKIVGWNVMLKNLENNVKEELQFDAVMICNGHHSVPHVPTISGSETFPGKLLHSHSYRKPEEFRDEIVILLGASLSGIDIALELLKYASRVYLSHDKEKLPHNVPSCVNQVPGIAKIEKNKIFLKDRRTILTVDSLIYCTGYEYNFSFLDDDSGIKVDENCVTPLYKHTINVNHPTMCFIGLPNSVLPFTVAHVQVQYFTSLLKEKFKLPSLEIMTSDVKLEDNPRKKYYHDLANEKQWLYYRSLIEEANIERLPEFYENGFKMWIAAFCQYTSRAKDFKFVILEDKKTTKLLNRCGKEVSPSNVDIEGFRC